ncbi:MAG: class I SAM-dependent methyltransferase, partial [Planctomycetia bacterium]|nr:class I SAM-dependent methyltransferase [Planctomycetia bacterium]
MKIIEPTREENRILNRLYDEPFDMFEMIRADREFLNSLILRHKPKKLLEVGVSAGISSVLMLNAIKNDPDAKLYSIDLATKWYRDETKNTGFIVDRYPELQKEGKWNLFTGKLAYEYMSTIGNEIDFVLLDAVHCHPGELLDYLMFLPFLKKNCPIVLHDINIHTIGFPSPCERRAITNNTLFSAFSGERLVLKDNMRYGMGGGTPLPNIGGVILAEDAMDHVYEVFNALSIPWDYMPSDNDLINLREYFARFYDAVSLDLFDRIINYQQFVQTSTAYVNRPWRKKFRKNRYLLLAQRTRGSLREKFQAKANKYIRQEKIADLIRAVRTLNVDQEVLWNNAWRVFDERLAKPVANASE